MSARARILVVEDEPVVALDLRGALEEFGYAVVGTAASSHDALGKAAETQPDLVLMDIRIEGPLDGIQTAMLIRGRHGAQIVYLTANADPASVERALSSRPEAYLKKPYDTHTLRAAIELAIQRREAEAECREVWARAHEETNQLQQAASALREANDRLSEESLMDPLTELYNRRHLGRAVRRELSLAQRQQHPVALILLDLDRFKSINDSYGHAAGDAALRSVAALLRSRLRVYDVACRYGGDEFVILVPGAALTGAQVLAARLRAAIEQLVIADNGATIGQVTASFGLAAFPEHGDTLDALLRVADSALYRAKAGGRNRIGGPPP